MSFPLYAMLFVLMQTISASPTVQYSSEAAQTEITNLPGLPESGVHFKMFSGYIEVAPGRHMFYWFAESQKAPSTDPVLLWTNGGPGCSGLGGFMTEQGPFRPTADGKLELNPHSWNMVANTVFIEQPAGVGFSFVDAPLSAYNDSLAASDNAAFVRGFFERYSSYKASEFYITSESYGGHYMPTLARELVNGGAPGVNFKGFMVGNPLTYMPYRDYGMYGTFAGHNLVDKPTWDRYLAAGCREDDSSDECGALMKMMDGLTAGMDPYALDFPVCTTAGATGRHERYTVLRAAGRLPPEYFPATYTPCDTNWATTYLNRADVQAAIGAKAGTKWGECSDEVSSSYSQTDVVKPMMPIYKELIEGNHKLRILVYSGDDDAICATLGTQQWVWDLGYNVSSPWAPWTMDGQTSGFHVSFGKGGSAFHFATVHGAGHMVPATRPAQSLEVLKKYLAGLEKF